MTKFGVKIIGVLKIAPYYFVFLAGASAYSIYADLYPRFEWGETYAYFNLILASLSALGIWYEQKWSVLTVTAVIISMIYLQSFMLTPVYVMPILLCVVIWALIETLFLHNKTEEHNQVPKKDADNKSSGS